MAAATPGRRARRREIDGLDPGMSVRRAQHQTFELPLVAHVERIDRGAGHLLPRFDARRAFRVPVMLARARLRDRAEDIVIGAASAEVARERRGDLLARRRRRAARGAPRVVERSRLDNEAGRAETALQRVEGHEGALHRMQFVGADAFDGGDGPARRRLCRHQAADDGRPVDAGRCRLRKRRPRTPAWFRSDEAHPAKRRRAMRPGHREASPRGR